MSVFADWVTKPLTVSLIQDSSTNWNVVPDKFKEFDLRVGDANSDGYPDLIVTLQNADSKESRVCLGSEVGK